MACVSSQKMECGSSQRMAGGSSQGMPSTEKSGRPSIPSLPSSIFVAPNVDDFTCKICKDVLIDPVEISTEGCGHIFCRQCITKYFQSCKACPLCHKAATSSSLRGATLRFLSRFNRFETPDGKVPCPREGCFLMIPRENVLRHISQCKRDYVLCTKGCAELIGVGTESEHDCVQHQENLLKEERDELFSLVEWLRNRFSAEYLQRSVTAFQHKMGWPPSTAADLKDENTGIKEMEERVQETSTFDPVSLVAGINEDEKPRFCTFSVATLEREVEDSREKIGYLQSRMDDVNAEIRELKEAKEAGEEPDLFSQEEQPRLEKSKTKAKRVQSTMKSESTLKDETQDLPKRSKKLKGASRPSTSASGTESSYSTASETGEPIPGPSRSSGSTSAAVSSSVQVSQDGQLKCEDMEDGMYQFTCQLGLPLDLADGGEVKSSVVEKHRFLYQVIVRRCGFFLGLLLYCEPSFRKSGPCWRVEFAISLQRPGWDRYVRSYQDAKMFTRESSIHGFPKFCKFLSRSDAKNPVGVQQQLLKVEIYTLATQSHVPKPLLYPPLFEEYVFKNVSSMLYGDANMSPPMDCFFGTWKLCLKRSKFGAEISVYPQRYAKRDLNLNPRITFILKGKDPEHSDYVFHSDLRVGSCMTFSKWDTFQRSYITNEGTVMVSVVVNPFSLSPFGLLN